MRLNNQQYPKISICFLGKLVEKESTGAIHRTIGSAHTAEAAELVTV